MQGTACDLFITASLILSSCWFDWRALLLGRLLSALSHSPSSILILVLVVAGLLLCRLGRFWSLCIVSWLRSRSRSYLWLFDSCSIVGIRIRISRGRLDHWLFNWSGSSFFSLSSDLCSSSISIGILVVVKSSFPIWLGSLNDERILFDDTFAGCQVKIDFLLRYIHNTLLKLILVDCVHLEIFSFYVNCARWYGTSRVRIIHARFANIDLTSAGYPGRFKRQCTALTKESPRRIVATRGSNVRPHAHHVDFMFTDPALLIITEVCLDGIITGEWLRHSCLEFVGLYEGGIDLFSGQIKLANESTSDVCWGLWLARSSFDIALKNLHIVDFSRLDIVHLSSSKWCD